jgi:hypothetical protein
MRELQSFCGEITAAGPRQPDCHQTSGLLRKVFALTPLKIHIAIVSDNLRLNVAQHSAGIGMALKQMRLNPPNGEPDHESPHRHR